MKLQQKNDTAKQKRNKNYKIKGAHQSNSHLVVQQQLRLTMKQESLHQFKLKSNQTSNHQSQDQKSKKNNSADPLRWQKVPIYKIINQTVSIQSKIDRDSYFALGTLLGKFYQKEKNIKFETVLFVGQFKGSIELEQAANGGLYFQGNINNLILLRMWQDQVRAADHQYTCQSFADLAFEQTSFRGFFKGKFYSWKDISDLTQKHTKKQSILELIGKKELQEFLLPNLTLKIYQSSMSQSLKNSKKEINSIDSSMNKRLKQKLIINVNQKEVKEPKKKRPQYYLPCAMRFEIQDVREINLEKSMAVVSGHLYIEIRYNNEIDRFIKNTFTQKKKKAKAKNIESQSLLKLIIQFNRDFSLTLPLEELEDDYLEQQGNQHDDQQSNSDWSIQDKTWDIQVERDDDEKVIRFKVWKRLNAEIDNSYGAFFAPFNLSVLRIVVTANSFTLLNNDNQKVKVNLSGTDVLDFTSQENYDPFRPLSELKASSQAQAINRLHKISKTQGKDNGIYIIADNRLTCYPHYKNILINKCTSNADAYWGFGLTDKKALLCAPEVKKISQLYKDFDEKRAHQKYAPFTFLKWNYFAIEIPIYKYVVIEMLQIFVPLLLLSIISLLIFKQSNGVSEDSGYTTLSLRIVNVCSLMIAYVSLVPTLRKNLPPMPTVSLIQIITYINTLPNFLALLNSMAYYTVSLSDWQTNYQEFQDGIFLFCFIVTVLCLLTLLTVLVTYSLREYNVKLQKRSPVSKSAISYSSPHYVKFMQDLNYTNRGYSIQKLE